MLTIFEFIMEDIKYVEKFNYNIPKIIYDNSIIESDDITKWKTKTLLANSGGKVGDMKRVGLVLVSNDVLIPVSENDLHHGGYDLLTDYYFKNNLIDKTSYQNIYINSNNNSVATFLSLGNNINKDNESYFKKSIDILETWLNKTKLDLPIKISQTKYGKGYEWDDGDFKTISDLVKDFKNKNFFEIYSDLIDNKKYNTNISKTGQKVIQIIEEIYYDIKNFKSKQAFNKTYKLLELIKPFIKNLTYQDFIEDLTNIYDVSDLNKLELLLFGFSGIKNFIHNKIRMRDDKIKLLFDNLNVAYSEFNRLSNL